MSRYVRWAIGSLFVLVGAQIPALAGATESIGQEIGNVIGNPIVGLAVWAAVHGLSVLFVDGPYRHVPVPERDRLINATAPLSTEGADLVKTEG